MCKRGCKDLTNKIDGSVSNLLCLDEQGYLLGVYFISFTLISVGGRRQGTAAPPVGQILILLGQIFQ